MACAQSPATGAAEKGQDLLTPLLEALTLEPKYQPALALPHTAKVSFKRSLLGGVSGRLFMGLIRGQRVLGGLDCVWEVVGSGLMFGLVSLLFPVLVILFFIIILLPLPLRCSCTAACLRV